MTNIKQYLKDNCIYIVPDNEKINFIKLVSEKGLFLNINVFSLSEIKKKILFDYNEQTIHYLISKHNYTYYNAIDLLETLYYIDDEKDNKELYEIKQELEENDLLFYDKLFLNSVKNKVVYIMGFSYLYKLDKHIIRLIEKTSDVQIIMQENNLFSHNILNFKDLNEEIEFIANDILKKIEMGININKIFLANVSNDYLSTIKRIFNFYKIPINLNEKKPLYYIEKVKDIIDNLQNVETALFDIENYNIQNELINILNKYTWSDSFLEIKDMITYELKNTYIKNEKEVNAVNIKEFKNFFINEDEYIYLVGFSNVYIPKIYKDEDFLSDKFKPELMEKSWEKTKIEASLISQNISSIKNLTITRANNNLKQNLLISSLAENFTIKDASYNISNYSKLSNEFNFAILMDKYLKYGTKDNVLEKLFFNYKNTPYLTYSNKYNVINPKLIKKHFNDKLSLSYSKLNNYYECAFKYYLDYILRLSNYEETFEIYLGNFTHHILSQIYSDEFDFDLEKTNFLKSNYYNLTNENKVFLEKMCDELKYAINHLKTFNKHSKFVDVDCEKEITVTKNGEPDIVFTGIVDKVIKYDDKLAIIDYKTYHPDIDLGLINHGLKAQLPLYIYLIKNFYPESEIVGIYLQHITRVIPSFDNKKTIEEIKNDSLKLVGFSTDKESILENLDDTYTKSKYIKSLSLTKNGFSHYAKLLNEKQFNNLFKIAEKLINRSVDNILKGDFTINPKIVDKINLSCTYCKYKSICFVKDDDFVYINKEKKLEFLEGDNNASMD